MKTLILAAALLLMAPQGSALAEPVTAFPIRIFHADMTADNETKFTESPATGQAEFTLDLIARQVKWTISYKDLGSAPVSIGIFGPAQPGANGQLMFDLAPKGLKSPIIGSSPVTESQIQYFLYGWTYVNLVTKNFEKGEIRGQLDIKPPEKAH